MAGQRPRGGYATLGQSTFSGGLNVTDGVDVLAPDQAIDLLNVLFLPQGGVGQRDGYQRFTSVELTGRPDSMAAYYTSAGARQLIVGGGNRLDALDTSGTSIANVATATSPHSFARFGAPGSEHMYIANGTDQLRRWDGAAFTAPVYIGTDAVPTGKLVAVQAADNRLVSARYAGFPDRVAFSEPGLPLTWNEHVDLRPGSGEPITALVSWREYVFAFKETEYFVFYGTTTDSTGRPIFNYRPASVQAGSMGPVAVAPEGVYFMNRRGIWLTTGGEPKLISPQLDPLFLGGASLYYQGGSVSTAQLANARMYWTQGRLYVSFATSTTNDRTLVYSSQNGWWTLYDIGMSAIASFRPSNREELVFGYAAGTNSIGRYFEGSGFLRDDLLASGAGGAAISSRWRQGWIDYGTQDQKWLRQTKLWGSGNVTVGIARDFDALPGRFDAVQFSGSGVDLWETGAGPSLWGDGSDSTKLWGPASTTAPWLVSQSVSGHLLSLALSNSTLDQSWSLHRLEHGFHQPRSPEVLGRFGS